MAKFEVAVEWAGYSRGVKVLEVEAETEAEARKNFRSGKEIERTIMRDDTETGDILAVKPLA